MSDLDLTKNTNFSQNQNTGSSQNLKDQVADAGAEVKQRADEALRASTDAAREQFKEAIRTKLVLEIAARTPEHRIVPAQARRPRISCTVGEQMWRDRWGN